MIRPNVIDLNSIEVNFFLFLITLDKCNVIWNVVDNLSTKIQVPGKRKDINVKVFNMTMRINETKALVKHISCNCKCKFNSITCNWN